MGNGKFGEALAYVWGGPRTALKESLWVELDGSIDEDFYAFWEDATHPELLLHDWLEERMQDLLYMLDEDLYAGYPEAANDRR